MDDTLKRIDALLKTNSENVLHDLLEDLKTTAETLRDGGTEQMILTLPTIMTTLEIIAQDMGCSSSYEESPRTAGNRHGEGHAACKQQPFVTNEEILVKGHDTAMKKQGKVLPSAGKVVPPAGKVLPSAGRVVPSAGKVLPSDGSVGGRLLWEKAVVSDDSDLWDIAFTQDGNIAVIDNQKQVYLRDDRGRRVKRDGRSVASRESFKCLLGIAFHAEQNILVACDIGTGYVSFLDPVTLKVKKQIQLEGISKPWHIAVLQDGCLLVCGLRGQYTNDVCQIGVFDIDGKALNMWNSFTYFHRGVQRHLGDHVGCIAVDSEDHIYLSRWSEKLIVKFNKAGETLCVWSTENEPRGLAVCGNRVLVAVRDHGVVSYTLDGTDKNTIVTWNKDMYNDIMSVAVWGNKMAASGLGGVRMYQLER